MLRDLGLAYLAAGCALSLKNLWTLLMLLLGNDRWPSPAQIAAFKVVKHDLTLATSTRMKTTFFGRFIFGVVLATIVSTFLWPLILLRHARRHSRNKRQP